MDPYEFEQLIAELLEEWGWESVVTSGSNDKGVDISVSRSAPFPQKYAIQVKQNSEGNRIGSPKIQQYSSILNQEDSVDGVVVITTSSFTSQAREISTNLGVKLLDGDDLIKLFMEPDGQVMLRRYFDFPSNSSKDSPSSEELAKRAPPKNPKEPGTEPKRVFDGICERYGRGLNGPRKLDGQSCPLCSGIVYGGKIVHMRESREIKFCTDCDTVFIGKENGWKQKPINT
ncbi:restriction endonuclease [Halorubrum saccharovorum]|uniref:restriction endonuclease n=1 Tax=Halorubrum saccharovorum TaxID=2248 RepID=UPI0009B5A425|nr:restriction endonuclease [Halorubrum saccharovorum]